MADGFVTYPTEKNGDLATVIVDLSVTAPDRRLSVALVATVSNERPRVEDRVAELANRLGGRYLGHRRVAAWTFVVGYLPALPSSPVQVDGADISVTTDPEWTVFADLLAPSPRDGQAIADTRVFAELVAIGDDVSQPRLVSHHVAMPDNATRDEFIVEMDTAGFETSLDADGRLTVTRTEPVFVGPGGISDTTWFVRQQAERRGGSYDGWGAAPAGGALRRWWRRRRTRALVPPQ